MSDFFLVVYLLIGTIVAGLAYGVLSDDKKDDVQAFNLFMVAVLWPLMLLLYAGAVVGGILRDA